MKSNKKKCLVCLLLAMIYLNGYGQDFPNIVNLGFDNNAPTNFACPDQRIKLELKCPSSNCTLPFNVECKNVSGNWERIMPTTSNEYRVGDYLYMYYSDFLYIPNLDPHQPMYFRIISHVPYCISEFTSKAPYYLPEFKFPIGTSVIVEASCPGDPFTIKIPYEGTRDYRLTIKGADEYSWGNNPSLLACPTEIIDGVIYYQLSMDLDPGVYELIIENKVGGSSPCPIKTSFFVPNVPDFTISQPTYTTYTDNSEQEIQVLKHEGTASVSFTIKGSRDQSVSIRVGDNNFTRQLPDYSIVSGIIYYEGTVSIDLPKGTYTNVYVDNAFGCSAIYSNSFELKESTPISYSFTPSNPKCNGQLGNLALSNIKGGIGPYQYQLNNSGNWQAISNASENIPIAPGEYVITVADSCKNVLTQAFSILLAPSVISIETVITPPSIYGGDDGKIAIIASGGTPFPGGTYQYSKDNANYQTSNVLTDCSGGQQTIYVKDANECMYSFYISVPQGRQFKIESTTTTAPSCNGNADGKCVLTIGNIEGELSVSGLPQYCTYNITNNTTITIFGLETGNYPYKITETFNGKSYSIESNFSIPIKQAIKIVSTITPVSDKNSSTGKISVSLSGGNPENYRVSLLDIANNQSSEEISTPNSCIFENLAGAHNSDGGKAYKIQVIDSQGCSKDTIVRVPEPEFKLQLTATLTQPIFCHNDSDAEINIVATGGWGNYQYSRDSITWNTTTQFTGLSSGTYKFYVKDINGGTDSTSFTIINPEALSIVVDSIGNARCFGASSGSIRFLVSGGTPAYSLTPAIGTVTTSTENGNTYMTVNNLPKGDYVFTLKDSHNCTLQAAQATIDQPDKLSVSTSDLKHPTCGWENGSITATASGGIAPYTYTLKVTGANAVVQTKESSLAVGFEDIAGGNYYIAVTDQNDCMETSVPLVFNQYTSPVISGVIINDVICFGESNGKITASTQKGTADIDYFILTNTLDNAVIQNDTGIFENLSAGNYILYVFDQNSCRSQNAYPVAVKQPDVLRIEIDTIVPVIHKGAGDGKIQFRVMGGNTGNATVYLKEEANRIDSISAIKGFSNELSVKAGIYTLEVSDNKDCYFTTEVFQVNEPADSLRLIIKEVQDALCKSQTGRIVVEGQGGWGDYRYKRAVDGQFTTLKRFENLYPGTYFITVTDKMGATASKSITIYEPQDSLKAEIIHIQTPTCANNGALSIKLSGGTPPYKLFSDNGNDTIYAATPESIQWANVESGALLLHLTDANTCKFELETLVSDTALLQITGFEVIPPNLPNVPNGSIHAKTSGGTHPLSYSWRKIGQVASFPNNPLIDNLSSGYYELKVSDGNACSVTASVYLPDPNDGTISVVEIGDETAFEAANGYAILYSDWNFTNIRVIHPDNNYTDYPATSHTTDFYISNDNIYLNNLAGGTWLVIGSTVSEQNAIVQFEIKVCKALVFGKIEILPVSNPNGSNGAIHVEIQGGAGENTFVWTDEEGNTLFSEDDEYSSRINNLPAGKYTVTVTDKYGNTISKELEVVAPEEALQLKLLEQKNQSCNAVVDAYVIVSAIGGWGDYRYAHERQAVNTTLEYSNTEVYPDLETGEHYFHVVDKYGTTAQLKISVSEPDLLRASVANVENVKCKDDVNGQITFDISGGNPPYYFRELGASIWQKGNVTNLLPAGKYNFEFTDSLQCSCPDRLAVSVTEPDSLLFENVEVTHTTCAEDNGQIRVALKGGTRPYTYQWRDTENNLIGRDSIITNLKQNALYRLYVSDKNDCTQYLEQMIQGSKRPRITGVETTDVLCYGDFTGAARITAVEAGVPDSPCFFTWSNGSTGDSTKNLPAGRHSVTVTDENSCATTYYFDIRQPDSLYLLITAYKEPHCFGYSDAYIHTQTIGGAGAYTYLWSNGETTPNIEDIPAGNYWVQVSDAHGCMFEKQFTLNEPPYQHIDLGEDLMMCPGNTHVIDGGSYVSYRWFTDKGDIYNDRYLSVTDEDRYYLEAKMPNGCSAWGDIGITIGNNALQAGILLASEAAVGDTLVIFELSNLPLDSLKWEYNPAAFEQITIEDEFYNLPYVLQLRCLQTGIYNIGLMAYSGGCYSPAVKQVEIVEAEDREADDWWGQEPLIQSLSQYPNPTDGNFTVELELREAAEARFLIFEVASGICLEQRTESGSDYYRVSYNLTHLQSGIYVLIVTAGNERRQVKVVIE